VEAPVFFTGRKSFLYAGAWPGAQPHPAHNGAQYQKQGGDNGNYSNHGKEFSPLHYRQRMVQSVVLNTT
jgi:hypothetical protein